MDSDDIVIGEGIDQKVKDFSLEHGSSLRLLEIPTYRYVDQSDASRQIRYEKQIGDLKNVIADLYANNSDPLASVLVGIVLIQICADASRAVPAGLAVRKMVKEAVERCYNGPNPDDPENPNPPINDSDVVM